MNTDLITSVEAQLTGLGIAWTQNIEETVPPYYYDGESYYYQDDNGHFFRMNEQSLLRRLKRDGYEVEDGEKKTSAPFITLVQEKHAVSFCGALAGYQPGAYQLRGGDRILVTRSTKIATPEPGDWSTIDAWIRGMLDSGDLIQSIYFYGWLKVFLQSFVAQMNSKEPLDHLLPGQCLVLAGPVNVGKSLLIDSLLIPMFGGRVAKPLAFMSGKTSFNGDSAGAPLLTIDDEGAGRDRRSRSQFASKIKEYCFAPGLYIHGKYKEAMILKPCQRLVIAANDDADHITILPTIDDSMKAKLMLLRVNANPVPIASGLIDDREKFRALIASQIPAFINFLLFEFEIPENLRSKRCGISHFHHPDLIALLEDIDTDSQLLEAIDKLFVKGRFCSKEDIMVPPETRFGPWEGSASDFEDVMRRELEYWQSSRFFRYDNSAGMALRRLSQSSPSRVKRGKFKNGTLRWIINPPPPGDTESTPTKLPVDRTGGGRLLERLMALSSDRGLGVRT